MFKSNPLLYYDVIPGIAVASRLLIRNYRKRLLKLLRSSRLLLPPAMRLPIIHPLNKIRGNDMRDAARYAFVLNDIEVPRR